jgi:hypothetical protein
VSTVSYSTAESFGGSNSQYRFRVKAALSRPSHDEGGDPWVCHQRLA